MELLGGDGLFELVLLLLSVASSMAESLPLPLVLLWELRLCRDSLPLEPWLLVSVSSCWVPSISRLPRVLLPRSPREDASHGRFIPAAPASQWCEEPETKGSKKKTFWAMCAGSSAAMRPGHVPPLTGHPNTTESDAVFHFARSAVQTAPTNASFFVFFLSFVSRVLVSGHPGSMFRSRAGAVYSGHLALPRAAPLCFGLQHSCSYHSVQHVSPQRLAPPTSSDWMSNDNIPAP